jgi:hypothetical protein
MPRMRCLKPSFFTDSELAELPPLHRLAFQGLWCVADRDGRLEDKPRELKVQVLPYDDCDFEQILVDLARPKRGGAEPGFIIRYQAGARRCIQITHFAQHQKPHPKEASCNLPVPPPWKAAASTDLAVKLHGESGGSGNGNGNGLWEVEVEPAPAAAPPPPPKPPTPVAATVTAPTTPPETWGGMDFWAWAQDRRRAGGYLPERPPNPRKLSAWYSAALMTPGVTARRLKDGFYRFGESSHWAGADPPYPFAAFMSQWEQFTRPEPGAEPSSEVSHAAA